VIGLAGSHRVGKSTLAALYAERFKIPFAKTSGSEVFRRLGIDPAAPMSFETRLMCQEALLKMLQETYQDICGEFITDRTPIDLIAYTLGDAVGDAVPAELRPRLERYVHDCFEVTNKYFDAILVVQPGIPIVPAEGKAAPNWAYIEHLNAVCLGLVVDERVKCDHYFIPRRYLDMESRLSAIQFAHERARSKAIATHESLRANGIPIH
jgi:hypothetical protein